MGIHPLTTGGNAGGFPTCLPGSGSFNCGLAETPATRSSLLPITSCFLVIENPGTAADHSGTIPPWVGQRIGVEHRSDKLMLPVRQERRLAGNGLATPTYGKT